jgi:TP901 family phage tail tape measure protein
MHRTPGRRIELDRKLALTILLNGVDKLSGPLKKIVGLGERSGQSLARLTRAARAADRELADLRRELEGATGNVTELIERERALEDAVSRANGAVERQRQIMSIDNTVSAMHQRAEELVASGQENAVEGAAILAPFILATKGAMEFSSGMVDLQQKAGLTNAELIRMQGYILAASRATHQLPEDMRAAVDVLAGFGMDPRQAVKLAEPIGRLGTAFKVELADAAAAAYANINNLKVPLSDTARAFDIMAAGSNAGAFEIKDMARWFPTLTARMQALGQTGVPAVTDLTAALQVAMNTAGSADEAANNIANLMAKINAPGTIRAFQKNFGVDLPSALRKLEAQGMTTMEAFAVIAKQATGGDMRKLGWGVEDQQAQMGLLALIQNMDEYRRIRGEIANSSGTIDVAFDQREVNDGMVAWQAFRVQLSTTALVLGTKLLPIASQFLTIAAGMASAVGDFAAANPQLTTGLLYLVAGAGAAKVALGGLQIVFGTILRPMASAWGVYAKWRNASSIVRAFPNAARSFVRLRQAARAMTSGLGTAAVKGFTLLRTAALFMAKGVMRAGLMMMANPMVLGITAIAVGIGVAAYLIYTHWDTIKAAFATAVGWLGGVWEWIKAKFMAFPGLFGPIGLAAHAVITNWDAIRAGFDTAMGWMGTAWEWIKGKLHLLPALFGPLGLIGTLVTTHWSSVRSAFAAGTAMIGQAWQMIRGAFGEGIAWLQGLGGQMASYGRAIINGLVRGIQAAPGAVWNALKSVVMRGVDNIRAFLGIKSPSRLFAEMGGFMTEGMAIGLDRSAPGAVGAARRMAVAVAAAMTVPTLPAPAMAQPGDLAFGTEIAAPQAPRLPTMEALRIQSAIASPVLPQLPRPDDLAFGAQITALQAPRLPTMETLRIQSAIASLALPQLPRPDDLAFGAEITALQAPRLPTMEALRIQSAITAPALPQLPRSDDLAIGSDVAEPAVPRLPALGRMRLPVDLDIARQLDLPDALMRVIPQMASVAKLEARQEALQPQAQFATPVAGREREDRVPLRPSAPAAGMTLNITIQQQPGEDGEQLARRVADIIERRSTSSRLGAYRDE